MAGAEGFGGENRRLPPNGYKICNSDLIFEFSMSKNIGLDISHIKIEEFKFWSLAAAAGGSSGQWRWRRAIAAAVGNRIENHILTLDLTLAPSKSLT